MSTVLREPAEVRDAAELEALADDDREAGRATPPGWRLSPIAVRTYVTGGELPGGRVVAPKWIGPRRLVEVAIATLATDRALLLSGVPGTGKSWLAEHLAAAICGDSRRLVQGTAGTDESAVRYGWDYARLLADGPSRDALVPSPVLRAMEAGQLARIEELTRLPTEVQDALITVLSEKAMPVPELDLVVPATRGFNLIATANRRDRGVQALSSALARRFATVVLPVPATLDEEVTIVAQRVAALGAALELPPPRTPLDAIRRVVTVFRELREGVTEDGHTRLRQPEASLSPAEAISVVTSALAMATHYGDGEIGDTELAGPLEAAVVRDPARDGVAWREYVQAVVGVRPGWEGLADALGAVRTDDARTHEG